MDISAKRSLRILFPALLLAGCAQQAPTPAPVAVQRAPAPAAPVPVGDPVAGLHVANRVGCLSCHGPDGRGEKLWDAPGEYQLYSANLTEKRALYDDAGIEGLLRHGRTHDGHRPFGMPIKMFQHLSDHEIRDITAWLRSLPEVANPGLQKSWFSDKVKQQLADGTYPEDEDIPDPAVHAMAEPPGGDPVAIGHHIAMTSCTECHGPDLNGVEDFTPSLIVAKSYDDAMFARLMKTGITMTGKPSKTGLMSEMGRVRFSTMTADEVAALKQYLDSR